MQLPLEVDGILRARATKDGLSPGRLIADVVGRWVVAAGAVDTLTSLNVTLPGQAPPPRAPVTRQTRRETNIRSVPKLPGVCEHKRASVVAAGLRRCVDCGAVRGVDQVWRAAGES